MSSWGGGGGGGWGGGGFSPVTPSAGGGHHGGGAFGFLSPAEHLGKWLAAKTELAGRDIVGMPGGLYYVGRRLGTDVAHGNWSDAEKLGIAMGKGFYQPLEHPLRDPFATLLTVMPYTKAAGEAVMLGRVGRLAAEAGGIESLTGRTGLAGLRAARRVATGTRELSAGDLTTRLVPSKHPFVRAAQEGYDRIVQSHILKEEAAGRAGMQLGRVPRMIARHGQNRVFNAAAEGLRLQQRIMAVPASLLDRAAHNLIHKSFIGIKYGRKLSKDDERLAQAALEMTATNTTPEDAAAYHFDQARKGINPKLNTQVAHIYRRLDEKGWLTQDETGHVVVGPNAPEELGKVDAALAHNSLSTDEHLKDTNVMTEQGLRSRINAPAKIRAGGWYEKPTPGKMGISPALDAAVGEQEKWQARLNKQLQADADWHAGGGKWKTPSGKSVQGEPGVRPLHSPYADDIRISREKLDEVHGRVVSLAKQLNVRMKQVGVVGGEEFNLPGQTGRAAQEGKVYTSYATHEPVHVSGTVQAGTRGPLHGAEAPGSMPTFTASGIEAGMVPEDIAGMSATHSRIWNRFFHTIQGRDLARESGHQFRRSNRDELMALPDEPTGKVMNDLREALGQIQSTTGKLTPEQETGVHNAFKAFMEKTFSEEPAHKALGIGAEAPQGYIWVDRGVVNRLIPEAYRTTTLGGRALESINGAVTAATVYTRLGHIFTRALTNAATNIMQGSAMPQHIAHAVQIWRQMTDEEKWRTLAAAGQPGFESLPSSMNKVGRFASRGAQWWAQHIDAPFRFNSLIYELDRAGYRTLPEIRRAVAGIENRSDPEALMAARIADREAIAYDRLSPGEKRYITRVIWFYPWTKASTMWTLRSIFEHPFKMGALGVGSQLFQQAQAQAFGGRPPHYEAGLIPLSGGSRPWTTNFSTFSPMATAGDIAMALRHREDLAGMANPAVSAMLAGVTPAPGHRSWPADVVAAAVAPTGIAQALEAYMHPSKSTAIFQRTPGSVGWRWLGGPAVPRRASVAALQRDYGLDVSGR